MPNYTPLIKFSGILLPLLFLLWPALSLALKLEQQYPALPGTPSPAQGNFIDFLRYLYQIMLGAGLILALGFVLYAGLLYLLSAGYPPLNQRAKQLMLSAFLGLFILFASYVILSAIDPSLVVFGVKIASFQLGSFNLPEIKVTDIFPEKGLIPLGQTLNNIHLLEKEAYETAKLIEPLLFKADADNNLEGVMPLIEKLYEKMQQCTCSKFRAECLTPQGQSWTCPAACPPNQGDPCPPELRGEIVPKLERELNWTIEEILKLLDDWGFTQKLDENDKELRQKIESMLRAGLPDGIETFIQFLEDNLGTLSDDPEKRLERIEKLKDLLKKNVIVQITQLNTIVRKLTENRLDLDKHLAAIAQCRSDQSRRVLPCQQARAEYGGTGCKNELDFICAR